MKQLKLLICFICFFLDVHVKADECKQAPCLINAKVRRVEWKEPHVIAGKGALAEWRGKDIVHLVHGTFLASGAVHITTPFANFTCEDDCEALFEREADSVTIQSLRGEWTAVRKGEEQNYLVPVAMKVRFNPVRTDGRAQMEFPQSLPWEPTVKTWARLYPGSKESFKEAVEEFRPVWKEAVEAVSDLHQKTAEREIASYNKAQSAEQARRLAEEREDAALRKRFRERNFPGQ